MAIHFCRSLPFAAALVLGCAASAQVFTVTTEQVAGRYLEFKRTDVPLPKMHAGPFTLENLERSLASEQGYAMRPLPLNRRGLTLVANGAMSPDGTEYVKELNSKGISSRPGERVTITKITFHTDRIVFDLNGGPDVPHRVLRHVQIGAGAMMAPLAANTGEQATGSRLTLMFPGGVPNISGDQAKELLAPIVGFGEQSPQQAYAATLPPAIRDAVLQHHVLVGMDQEMVLHTVGAPAQKIREHDGSEMIEEWIYGAPPEKSEFVRFRGNRVSRVEDAEVGEPMVARTSDEMGGYWETVQGQPADTRMVKLGDQTQADRDAQNAPQAPPTLRNAGETLPSDKDTKQPTMKPVQFPSSTNGSSPSL